MPHAMSRLIRIWTCLLVGLIIASLHLTGSAASQSVNPPLSVTWAYLPSPLTNDGATVDAAFQLRSDIETDEYKLWLAGFGSDPLAKPELALIYENTLGGGFWPKVRLLLAVPIESIPPTLLAQARTADPAVSANMALLPLVELDQPLDADHTFTASMSVHRGTREVAIELRDSTSNQVLYAGYLSLATLPSAGLYAAAGAAFVPGDPSNGKPAALFEIKGLSAQDSYSRFGKPMVLSGLHWQLVEDTERTAKPLLTNRIVGTQKLSARVSWPAVTLDGVVELRDLSGGNEITIARTTWQLTPVDLPLGNLPPGAHHLTLWYVSNGDSYQLGGEDLQVLAGIERMDLAIELPDAANPLWVQPLHSKLTITSSQAIDGVEVEIVGDVASTGGVAQQLLLEKTHIEHLPKGVSQYSLVLQPPVLDRAADVMVAPKVFGVQFTPAKRLKTAGAWMLGDLELKLADSAVLATQTIVGSSPAPMQLVVRNAGNARVERKIAGTWVIASSLNRGASSFEPMITATQVNLAVGETTLLPLPVPKTDAPGWFTLQISLPEESNQPAIGLGPLYLGIPENSEKEITLQGGIMSIDGSPMYLRGIGFYDYNQRTAHEWQRDLQLYASWGMNLIEVFALPGSAAALRSFLDAAKQAGLYVAVEIDNSICDMPAKQRTNELLPYLAQWDHPSLVAWVLRDDSFYDPHYQGLAAIRSLIRQYDDRTPVTTTLLDARVADRLTAQQWANWASVLDFPIPYEYPVLRDGRVFNPLYRSTGGLDTVQVLAERTRTHWRDPELYMWQWVQSHSQRVTIEELGFGALESYTSTPDQLRLLTYLTITSGVRGLLYYRDRFFTDADYGVGRRNELATTWSVLGEVEDILAGGERFAVQKTPGGRNGDGVEVTGFRNGSAQVLLAVQHRFADVRFVGSGRIEPFTVSVPTHSADDQVFLLTSIGAAPIASVFQDGVLTFQTPELDLTGAFLITDDLARVSAIDAALKARLPVTAHSALLLLADTLAKIETVSAHLPPLSGSEAVLAEVEGVYQQAVADYKAGAWEKAYLAASGAGEQLRSLADSQLDAAEKANIGAADRKYLASYFSLPKSYGYKPSYAMEVSTKLTRLTAPLGGVGTSTQ